VPVEPREINEKYPTGYIGDYDDDNKEGENSDVKNDISA